MSEVNSPNDSFIKLRKKQFKLQHLKRLFFLFSQWKTWKFVDFYSDFDLSQTLKSPE